jgi:molybdopterin-guanine dinucleotide biosynthesis protein A
MQIADMGLLLGAYTAAMDIIFLAINAPFLPKALMLLLIKIMKSLIALAHTN